MVFVRVCTIKAKNFNYKHFHGFELIWLLDNRIFYIFISSVGVAAADFIYFHKLKPVYIVYKFKKKIYYTNRLKNVLKLAFIIKIVSEPGRDP